LFIFPSICQNLHIFDDISFCSSFGSLHANYDTIQNIAMRCTLSSQSHARNRYIATIVYRISVKIFIVAVSSTISELQLVTRITRICEGGVAKEPIKRGKLILSWRYS